MLKRLTIAGLGVAGTLFVVQIVASVLVAVHPGLLYRTHAYAEEGTSVGGTFSWFLSKLSMVPGGTAERQVVTVMVENSWDARPFHVGLENALAIVEMEVEGGITRFAVLLPGDNLPKRIGPVRSLRAYFLEIMEPWTSLLLFAGGSPEALEEVPAAGMPAINGLGRPKEFFRDESIPPPHNLFTDRESLRTIMVEWELVPTLWPPYAVGGAPSGQSAQTISLNLLSSVHNVTYTAEGREYVRVNGGIESAAHPANVVILEAPIASIGEYGRLTIPLAGGAMLLFRSGMAYEGRWKLTDTGLEFFNVQGRPLLFARGQTWITVLPILDRVTWK